MMKKIIQVICIGAVLGLYVGCSHTRDKEYRLKEELVEHESEFWFNQAISHVLLNRYMSKETQVVWGTNFHTAAPVPLGAVGPEKYTQRLKGIIHNDSIGRVLKKAVNEGMNVILVIGDGMGNMHMSLPVYLRHAEKDTVPTMFEKIMDKGSCAYVYTSTARGLVTGSAASGTAIACGSKTLMNMVGVDSSGKKLESALSLAKKNRYRTALVTDAGITDATPAAFYAHTINRDDEDKVAEQLLNSGEVDIILGGGGNRFLPQGVRLSDYTNAKVAEDFKSSRKDTMNLFEGFKRKSYHLCFNLSHLEQAQDNDRLLGLFSGGGLPAPINRDSATVLIPTVCDMGEKALKMLASADSSYFIMIECARIDWESHDNDIGAVYKGVEEMNQILETAYSYYAQAPEKTLLVFTSDHETGGLEIAYRKMPEKDREKKVLANGEVWENITNPLMNEQFVTNLKSQKKSISKILNGSTTTDELKRNLQNYLGVVLTNEEAELLFYSMTDYKKYKD